MLLVEQLAAKKHSFLHGSTLEDSGMKVRQSESQPISKPTRALPEM